jgi:hypothetical protein
MPLPCRPTALRSKGARGKGEAVIVLKIILWVFAIIGGMFILAAAGLLIMRWYLMRRMRQLTGEIGNIGEMFKQMMQAVPDVEVKLQPAPPDLLDDVPAARQGIDALKARGFVDAGRYTMPQLMGARIAGLANPQASAYATVAEVEGHGVLVDILTPYADGTYMTYSTLPDQGLERPPGKAMVRMPGVPVEELLERCLAERPKAAFKPVAPELLKAEFEKYSKEEMMWRMSHGFAQGSELDHAMDRDPELSATDPGERKEFKALAMQMMQAQAHGKTVESLEKEFIQQGGPAVEKWEEIEDRATFIYDGLPHAMVAGYLADMVADGDDADESEDKVDEFQARVEQRVKTVGARAAFAELNTQLPFEKQYHRIGEVQGVVPADVYLAPSDDDDEEYDDDDED